MGAGALSFAGNMKLAGGFPDNGYNIVGGTIALVFMASFTKNTVIARPVKAFAGLVLLAAAMYYVPVLFGNDEVKPKRRNG